MGHPPRIGRYDVIEPLGQGGMGRVFLARDSVLGRKVAVKIMRDDLGFPPEIRGALFDRMRHEARAAAAVSHPHMVTLHDMGEEEALGLFLVFEYVDGPTLRDKIAEGPVEPRLVAQIARQIGEALSEAHAAGVIHRDVKPENILLAKSGAKVTDFGIARLPDSTLTQAGAVLGTPAYSAPEALVSGSFSAESDQFSFATTLYEALAGTRAFPGDDAFTVASRVATEQPTPPSKILPLGRALGRVDAVLARALSKDPERRFSSCRAFGDSLARELEAALGAPHVTDTPPPLSSIVPRATRRVHNVATAVALLVIVGLVLVGRRSSREKASLREAANEYASVLQTAGPARPATRAGRAEPRPSTRTSDAGVPSAQDALGRSKRDETDATEDERTGIADAGGDAEGTARDGERDDVPRDGGADSGASSGTSSGAAGAGGSGRPDAAPPGASGGGGGGRAPLHERH
jgi:serine/threonine-protein kinase